MIPGVLRELRVSDEDTAALGAIPLLVAVAAGLGAAEQMWGVSDSTAWLLQHLRLKVGMA